MFYSQFILAKKGPLGTIWIAAHLERKLRKNQVADTDIGVSVDSILSPDIPIALRLSSHLLLGVVRIYSRKVNYLFHDCSETLLKVKQAFRSTVVDLPPEESTAPYHSITLPETFDLDDFVLPDALNGNFVDHHVSTREQITLQDTVEGTGHSTLQFGLDERFGDGDAPQIGLDLDEELFLDKGLSDHNASTPLALEEKMDNEMSGIPETPFAGMDIDDCQEAGTPRDMPPLQDPNMAAGFPNLYGYNIQTPDLNDIVFPSVDVGAPPAVLNDSDVYCPRNNGTHTDALDHAEAPSTPGLAEEATPARIHETPALSPRGKISPSNVVDDFMPETEKGFQDSTLQNGVNPPLTQSCDELPGGAAIREVDGQKIFEASEDEVCHTDATQKIYAATQILAEEVQVDSRMSPSNRLEMGKADSLDAQSQNLVVEVNSCLNGHKTTLGSDSSLKPCTSQSNQFDVASLEGQRLGGNDPQSSTAEMLAGDGVRNAEDSSMERQGEGLDSVADPKMHPISGCLPSENQANHSKQDELSRDVVSNNTQLGALNFSASSEYPEPEKMLLAPSSDHGLENDLEQGTSDKGTREPDGRVDGIKSLSGKKRYLVEKTPDLQSDSSVKVSGAPRSKRRIDHIPNDDDLLASILVGRGASTLKMKSTPSLPTIPFPKRSRLTPKIGVPKRKVLLDDTMVLHADTIRQQLMSTEDLRRTRRKAPCTRSEIWMIQKSFSEDETFGESVLTGMSAELNGLHYQTCELNEIEGYRDDANCAHSDASKLAFPSNSEIIEKASNEGLVNRTLLVSEKTDSSAQTSESHPQIVTQHCEAARISLEHDCLSSKPLNDEPNLLLEQSSLAEVVHHPEKDDNTVLADDDHITKEVPTLTESRNSDIVNEPSLVSPQDCIVDGLHNVNGEAFSSVDNSCIEVGSAKLTESTDVGDANICIPDFPAENCNSIVPSAIVNDQAAVEIGEGKLEASFDDQIGSSLCPPESSDMKTVISPLELPCLQGPSLQNNVDMEDVFGYPTTKDSDGYGSVTGGNVTDFLIDDEADIDEEAYYDIPNPEVQSLENSGWSVRTRGVARYLKLLFDNDSGIGRKTVEMDRLLAGKTRKEASRMFFETLVLKTKDYVHVEQGNSFENINIKPTAKLLKSEF